MNPGPGFCEVLAFYTNIVGHPCQNACGFVIGDGADQTTADAISDWLAPSYKAWLSNDSHWTGVRLIIGNDGPPAEFDSVSSAGSGSGGTNFEAPQVQGLIHKGTGLSGRKFRGRMYVADVAGDHIDSFGNLTGTEYADGMIEHDNHVGLLLKKLDDLGIANNTIVIYTTDNAAPKATG